ncbi:MAG: glutaredoxin domain-containing protein [archaeon]|jgi:glutaredoxin|nr:glutaredoxin domain-containing protein [archaeon]
MAQPEVEVWSRANCPACTAAKRTLDGLDVRWTERRADKDAAHQRRFQRATNGARTVPQIVVDGTCIGGMDDLRSLVRSGQFHALLGREPPAPRRRRWAFWRRDEAQNP